MKLQSRDHIPMLKKGFLEEKMLVPRSGLQLEEEEEVTLPAREGQSARGRAQSTSEPAARGAASAASGLWSS